VSISTVSSTASKLSSQLNHFVHSQTQGAIVNVSSIHGFLAKAGDPAYGECSVEMFSARSLQGSTCQSRLNTQ
jgi:short-subunit dehydrogenase involved in D-alanine esterification of teichoic acids